MFENIKISLVLKVLITAIKFLAKERYLHLIKLRKNRESACKDDAICNNYVLYE